MHTSVRAVFHKRVCDWYHTWTQLSDIPKLTAYGIEIELQVCYSLTLTELRS